MNISVTISLTTPPRIENYFVNLKTTVQQVIDSFYQQGILSDRNVNMYEVRQHEKSDD